MTLVVRTSALVMVALVVSASLEAVDIWTVGVDNTRQGRNKFETVLTVANVPKLRKIREFMVDDKAARATITVMSNAPQSHRTGCGQMHTPAKGRTRR